MLSFSRMSTSPLSHILPQHPYQAAGALGAEVQATDAITDVDPVLGLAVEAVANDVEGNRLRVVLHDHGPRRAGAAGVVVNVLIASAVARNTADAGTARAGIPLGTVRVLAVTSAVTATRGTITPASTSVGDSAFTVSTSTGTVAVNPGITAAPTPHPAAAIARGIAPLPPQLHTGHTTTGGGVDMLIRGFTRLTRDDAPGRTGLWLLVVVFGIVDEVRHDGLLFLLLVRLSGG